MSTESKKITQLAETKEDNDLDKSYFVVAVNNNNYKLAYNTLKDKFSRDSSVYFKPNVFADIKNMSSDDEDKVLAAKGAKVLCTEINKKLTVDSGTKTTVSTKTQFNDRLEYTRDTDFRDYDVVNFKFLKAFLKEKGLIS
jgi:hypothetical protein